MRILGFTFPKAISSLYAKGTLVSVQQFCRTSLLLLDESVVSLPFSPCDHT